MDLNARLDEIIELYEDKSCDSGLLKALRTCLLKKYTHTTDRTSDGNRTFPPDMLGRTFNGIGEPIDDLGPIVSKLKRDVNGLPLNPVMREYPRNYIRTGISAIDGLTTLIRRSKAADLLRKRTSS